MRVPRSRERVRCTYCGARGEAGTLLEADLRGLRFEYCDAACATAHRQAVEVTGVLCADCDEPALGDSGCCDEHLFGPAEPVAEAAGAWRKAG